MNTIEKATVRPWWHKFDFEEENPTCVHCGIQMHLRVDCEWPENQSANLCGPCSINLIEQLIPEYDALCAVAEAAKKLAEASRSTRLEATGNLCEALETLSTLRAKEGKFEMEHPESYSELIGNCEDEQP